MTSTAKRCKRAAGFTLLEIVIVLMIVAMVIGGAASLMVFSSDEYALKKASRELEAMGKRARATSVLKQTPYALVFSASRVDLMPWAEAIGSDALARLSNEEEAEGEVETGAVHWELTLDNGMTADLRRWNSDQWLPVVQDEWQIWRFDPTGLCEPIRVKLHLNDSSMEMEFHPLTAAISSTEMDIR